MVGTSNFSDKAGNGQNTHKTGKAWVSCLRANAQLVPSSNFHSFVAAAIGSQAAIVDGLVSKTGCSGFLPPAKHWSTVDDGVDREPAARFAKKIDRTEHLRRCTS